MPDSSTPPVDPPASLAEHAGRVRRGVDDFDDAVPGHLQDWLDTRQRYPATDPGGAVDRLFLDRMAARGLHPRTGAELLTEDLGVAQEFVGADGDRLWVEVARTRGELALMQAQLAENDEAAQDLLNEACQVAESLEETAPAEAAAAWRLIAPFTEDPVDVLRRACGLDLEHPSPWAVFGLLSLAGRLMDGENPDDLPEAEEAVRTAQAMALRPGFPRSVAVRLELATARARLAGHQGQLEQAVTLASRALFLPVGEERAMTTVPARLLLIDLLMLTGDLTRARVETDALASLGVDRGDDGLADLARQFHAAINSRATESDFGGGASGL